MNLAERAIGRIITAASSTLTPEGVEGYRFHILDVNERTEMATIKTECFNCGAADVDTTDLDFADYVAAVVADHARVCYAAPSATPEHDAPDMGITVVYCPKCHQPFDIRTQPPCGHQP